MKTDASQHTHERRGPPRASAPPSAAALPERPGLRVLLLMLISCLTMLIATHAGMLSYRPNMSPYLNHQDNALMYAAMRGDAAGAREALDGGANVNVLDGLTWSPLLHAAARGDEPLCRLLLDRGADVQLRSRDKQTSLLVAVICSRADVVRLLIARGANVDGGGCKSGTPLLFASKSNHLEIARALLAAGADPSAGNCAGWTPLMAAAAARDPQATLLLDLLNAAADVGATDDEGNTAMHYAAGAGNARAAELLLRHGADPRHKNHAGQTPATRRRRRSQRNGQRAANAARRRASERQRRRGVGFGASTSQMRLFQHRRGERGAPDEQVPKESVPAAVDVNDRTCR